MNDTARGKNNDWEIGAEKASCWESDPNGRIQDFDGGGTSILVGPNAGSSGVDYSYMNGYVSDARISTVTVMWDDGKTQTEPLSSGFYLAIREGKARFLRITGKDAAGAVVYEKTFPPPAP